MQVRLLGFHLNVNSANLTLSEFIAATFGTKNNQNLTEDSRRALLINNESNPEYYIGLVLTIKDQKTFCRLVPGSGSFLVKVNELELDTKLMEFNFFVINKKTGTGLYQYYHQSCSLSSLGNMLAQKFHDYRDKLIKTEIEKLPQDDRSESKLNQIRKRFKAKFEWEVLVRAAKLENLIAELKRVKAFEWTLATPTVDVDELKPLAPHIRNQRSKLLFSLGAPVAVVATAVSSLVSSLGITKGRIEGKDADDIERVLRIINNPENYGEYDYDDLASKLNNLDLKQFHNTWMANELIKECKKQAHIFETPMES